MALKTYKELYPDSIVGGYGLIQALVAYPLTPFYSSDFDTSSALERAFSIKYGSRLVMSDFESLAPLHRYVTLYHMFGEKWKKLLTVYKQEYKPLDAYVLTEDGENSKDIEHSSETRHGKTITENGTNTGTVSDVGNDSTNSNMGVYGFNSVASVGSDTTSDIGTSTNTETRNLEDTRRTSYGGEDTMSGSDNESSTHKLTKKGNIGYNSPQELLKQEMELWAKPYFDIVFADIAEFAMLQVY